ncbi:conserved hypothetical protein [Neospora caninum Liverpool]|uniref:Uncharacterized protein n=1 Tax=Neospora caninum (strain Liverpool) TaxID=572307 RepID=F0V844_NEOCL|nr:conserved hypothetical protein [Neospora caninum Liverpool]CBZ49885.1 conserved hypothetical protein [Neospora caninum Liverpool]CEL64474.1 TPA: hypothetical protein BN1204_003700 [Neospora caninum Liverpool]|eukprot:XP_003879920.1 conserved hypothetical protein [Neospora caninum Liverpool]
MSKLSAFFEKKKKKSLKTSTPAGLGEKPKKEDESVLVVEEADSSEWVVEDQAKPASPQDEALATWLKVSVVDAASVRKKEPEKTWHTAVSGDDLRGEERRDEDASDPDGERAGIPVAASAAGEDGQDAGFVGEKSESPATKKWVPPSLRGKRAVGGGAGARINFDDDQDLATAAQLGFYSGKGAAKKKAVSPAQPPKEAKKEKEKKSAEEKNTLEDLPAVPEFDVWKYVKVEGVLAGSKAPQNDEAVRAKYLNRKRLAQRSA